MSAFEDSDRGAALHVARGGLAGPAEDATAAPGGPQTDFASLARLPDGRLVIVQTDTKQIVAVVSLR